MYKKLILGLTALLLIFGCSSNTPQPSQSVRHIIMWTLNDSIQGAERTQLIQEACADFYRLKPLIPGIISMEVVYEGRLPSSNCDFMFDIVLESEEALKNFTEHPEHLKNAGKLKPFIQSRTCLDVLIP